MICFLLIAIKLASVDTVCKFLMFKPAAFFVGVFVSAYV